MTEVYSLLAVAFVTVLSIGAGFRAAREVWR